MNQDVVVMDAEWSGSSAELGYDINGLMEEIYAFNLAEEQKVFVSKVPIAKAHRGTIFNVSSKKMGLLYSSDDSVASKELPAVITLKKPKKYQPKIWPSPFGPKQKKKQNYNKIPVGASLILPYLFLGSGRDADDDEFLKKEQITHVLNVTAEWHSKDRPGIITRKIIIKDFVTESIEQHFEAAFEFIDQCRDTKDGRVLVHCVVGKSRSSSVVLAYLMSRGMEKSLREAFKFVAKTRDFIRPNDNFLKELQSYERQLFGYEVPTLLHEDLPPMKDPHAMKKKNEAEAMKLIEKVVTKDLVNSLYEADNDSKQKANFSTKMRSHLKSHYKTEIKEMEISEKNFFKLVFKHVETL